ncbi:hypothetical protein BKI52_01690 [marine bacterium AO1-C]|nr:hypothetical protein BKI52_01690 [marine bacterium AO1-C]
MIIMKKTVLTKSGWNFQPLFFMFELHKKDLMPQSFSQKELNYLQDTDFLLTKHQINEKLMQLLEQTRQEIKQELAQLDFNFPAEIDIQNGKISKGEQYRQLPYWVLDYPRKYTQNDIFAFRTMIWWGHEISCTLILAEESWEKHHPIVLHNLLKQPQEDWYIGVNNTPWEYHFEEDNYQKLTDFESVNLTAELNKRRFFKISHQLDLNRLTELPSFALNTFQKALEILKAVEPL